MPRTPEQIEEAAANVEEWLDSLDPDETPAKDASPLRAIAEAVSAYGRADRDVRDAVAAARDDGFSWSAIGAMLGTSRQAANQRYGVTSGRDGSPEAGRSVPHPAGQVSSGSPRR